MRVTPEIPESVATQFGDGPDAVARRLLEDTVAENYCAGRLSQRQVAVTLGFDYWQTEKFFRERSLFQNYTAADLEMDSVPLDKIFGSK